MDKVDLQKKKPILGKSKPKSRRFLGVIPCSKNTPENQFNKKHLKAYLAGKKTFVFERELFFVKQIFV